MKTHKHKATLIFKDTYTRMSKQTCGSRIRRMHITFTRGGMFGVTEMEREMDNEGENNSTNDTIQGPCAS